MSNTRCPNCMEFALSQDGICGSCGFNVRTPKTISHTLKVGTALNKRYMVGKVLGEGGFGITYLGLDTKYNKKVAIKEYFPNGFVRRGEVGSSPTQFVTVINNETSGKFFAYGKDKFIKEGQNLARFANYPGIVSINDLFSENNTAYIVMEFAEGKTLKQILKERPTMPENEVLELFKPIIKSLAAMHDINIMHRDIAPDNIIVDPNKTAKLIDFGSTAEATGGESKATIALVKHGFAPEEQYAANRAGQGSWTDVYALCATMYRAIEGCVPPGAEERLRGRELPPFTQPASQMTAQTLIQGLALFAKDRIQNMYQLYFRLYGDNIRKEEVNPAKAPAASAPAAPVAPASAAPAPVNIPPSPATNNQSGVANPTPVYAEPNAQTPNVQVVPKKPPTKPAGLAATIGNGYFAMMMIGIIFALIIPLVSYILNTISLIRCCTARKQGNTTAGIVTNTIALVVALIANIVYAVNL